MDHIVVKNDWLIVIYLLRVIDLGTSNCGHLWNSCHATVMQIISPLGSRNRRGVQLSRWLTHELTKTETVFHEALGCALANGCCGSEVILPREQQSGRPVVYFPYPPSLSSLFYWAALVCSFSLTSVGSSAVCSLVHAKCGRGYPSALQSATVYCRFDNPRLHAGMQRFVFFDPALISAWLSLDTYLECSGCWISSLCLSSSIAWVKI